MDALSSSYIAGIDPLNKNNLSAQEQSGLYSLMPQGGYGLTPEPTPAALPSPYQIIGSTPTPSVTGTEELSDLQTWNVGPSQYGGNAQFITQPASAIGETSAQPYFDKWFPYESLQSEADYLDAKVGQGAQQAAQSRGLDFSGVEPSMSHEATDYVSQISPNLTPVGAEAADFERLYGPDVANSLMQPTLKLSGTIPQSTNGFFAPALIGENVPAPLAGAQPFGDGSTGNMYMMGLVGLQNPNPNEPGFVVGNNSDEFYGGPGYFYSPYGPPTSTPWLNPA
jgi:hypothetical protein